MAQQKKSDENFLRNAMIVVGLLIVVGGVAAWRIGSKSTGSTADTGDISVSETAIDTDGSYSIRVATTGYTPTKLIMKEGQRVKLQLLTNNTNGCARSFTIPKLGIIKNLKQTGTDTVEFTAPGKGEYVFQCSMGMFQGVIQVI